MSESEIQTKILNKLRQIPHSEWEKATLTNRAGSQDIKGHIRGYYIAIEIKKDKNNEPSPLQAYRIAKTNEKGGFSFWSFSWPLIEYKLYEFAKSKDFLLYD